MTRTAVFAGSFNPFTVGHADIVKRGLALFDTIIISVGINANKSSEDADERACRIAALYANEPKVKVVKWDGLTAELAISEGAKFLLRGVRSVRDFEYEREMADANRVCYGLETVLIYADPSLSWISSSLVRDLQRHNASSAIIDKLMPKP